MNDFLATSALILGAIVVLTAIFPSLFRIYAWLILRIFYKTRIYHADRIPATGPALIVCNHVSYIDWMAIWVASPRPVRFLFGTAFVGPGFYPFFKLFARNHTIPLDNRATRPHAMDESLQHAAKMLERGEVLVVFPEGRRSRNGQMLPFGRGIERILKLTSHPVPILPACISGQWGSWFSHSPRQSLYEWLTRRKVSLWFGEPMKTYDTTEVRAAIAENMADLAIAEREDFLPVARWFVQTATSTRNLFRTAFVDLATGTERKLTFAQGLVACWCLSSWLRKRLAAHPKEPVGLWLPTGLGSTLGNIALAFLGRTTVNMNYTAGRSANESAARQVKMKYVLTSPRFEAKVPLELPDDVERIYLEDALKAITKGQKLRRFLTLLLLPTWITERLIGTHRIKSDDILTIIFSSGSTGEPKGVMLSQANVASNSHSFHLGVNITRQDVMLSSLPFFHSFGYTVNLWAPVGIGCTAVYYPDPRAAKEIGEICRKYACTIMMGTATFLRFYLRRSGPEDFKSLRLLICGAEKLPVKVAQEFQEKFQVLPLEGYGCTELSPVVSTNMHDVEVAGVKQTANMLGTVGQPIPGVVAKAFDPETLAPLQPGVEGILLVKGPNVMAGYFEQPERTKKVMHNGWYITGDMGLIEPAGFIRITGRLSRFAKIAGEMVPLEKLEEELQDLLGTGERQLAVCAVPDEKRGERLIVLHLPEIGTKLEGILGQLPKRGIPNLWVPDHRDCYEIEAFPALGSGKMDLRGLNELAKSKAEKK